MLVLKNVDLVKDRINERVKKGGHGIPNALVDKRFEKSLHNLPTLISTVWYSSSVWQYQGISRNLL